MTGRDPGSGVELVGRLAPSPSGLLHLGHARSFLAAWWSARAAGGRLLLRIEDLDFERSRPEYDRAILEDLEWLGLDWDGPVLRQSADLTPYHEAIAGLLAQGAAYACVCTRKEIQDAIDAPHGSGDELRYPGTCRGRFESLAAAVAETGLPVGVRFQVPDRRLEVEDRVQGRVPCCPADECGDFILLRRDGAIAYQLAVVVDDARQGVNEVVRGEDLLPSAARQELIYQSLGHQPPGWAHLGLCLGHDGRRLSKRGGALPLQALRQSGQDPRRLVSQLATSLGLWTDGAGAPPMGPREWLPHWSWERVPAGPVELPS